MAAKEDVSPSNITVAALVVMLADAKLIVDEPAAPCTTGQSSSGVVCRGRWQNNGTAIGGFHQTQIYHVAQEPD